MLEMKDDRDTETDSILSDSVVWCLHQAKPADATGSFSGASGTSYEDTDNDGVSIFDSNDCFSTDDAAASTCQGALACWTPCKLLQVSGAAEHRPLPGKVRPAQADYSDPM